MDRKLQKYNWPVFLFWPILKEMLLQAFGNLITLCLQMPSQVTFIHASQNKLPERPHLPFFSRSLCPSVSHMSIYVFIWPLASLSRGVSILIEVKGHEAQRQNFHFPALCLIAALSFNLPLWFFLPSSIILFIFIFLSVPALLPPPSATTATTLNYDALCLQSTTKFIPSLANQVIAQHPHIIIHEILQNL